MGFNKRFIRFENLVYKYKSGGIKELVRYIKTSDALVIELGKAEEIVNLLEKNELDKIEEILKEEIENESST